MVRVLHWYPLSRIVLLAECEGGEWRLTDGRRYSGPYLESTTAMEDRETIRRLTYGEPLRGEQKT